MMALDDSRARSDAELLAAYAAGDQSAARALTFEYAPKVLSLSRRLLGGDMAEAEDVAQAAMLRLWKIAPDWRAGEARIGTWLYRVTVNLCTDRLRKRRGVGLDQAPEPEDDAPTAMDGMMTGDRVQALTTALDQLPERQKTALVLRHLQELGNPEIAEAMELTVEAVESLLSRGRRALKDILGGRREELGFER
jgi:RNA polymerase sigma-70 factor, ECF subfamily